MPLIKDNKFVVVGASFLGSKIVGEGLCRLCLQQHGLGSAALRNGNLYGENQHKRAIDATRVVTAWERIRAGLPPVIEGDGTQVTNFIYTGDVARANLLAMEAAANGPYKICSDRYLSFNEFMVVLLRVCGSSMKPEYHVDAAKVANPTVKKIGLSVGKAKHDLGWEPLVGIEDGMKRHVTRLDADKTNA